ncbi:hypothetical protein [Gracilibacillus saliphilus]|uniref:hypothetical protein n=1 Tax=Gracilibacillus saliphilus TaxID=543890 RepID=UPI0013D03763|nr:hypothetical protein [Gracilibacillus saliphilus]
MKVLVLRLKFKRMVLFLLFVYLAIVLLGNLVSEDTTIIRMRLMRDGYIIPFSTIANYLFNVLQKEVSLFKRVKGVAQR